MLQVTHLSSNFLGGTENYELQSFVTLQVYDDNDDDDEDDDDNDDD